jgi:hypothetical protein
VDDYDHIALIDGAFVGFEHTIRATMREIKSNDFAARLDVFLARLVQARAEAGFPRLLDDARIAAGYEQCSECGEVLTPDMRSGVLDLCANCAGRRCWREGAYSL